MHFSFKALIFANGGECAHAIRKNGMLPISPWNEEYTSGMILISVSIEALLHAIAKCLQVRQILGSLFDGGYNRCP
jgi:hypothetical protein